MKFSLDTNVCIRYLNGRSQSIRNKISTVPATDIVVCSVVRAELAYGASKSQSPDASAKKQARFLQPYSSLPFDDIAALEFGRIRAYLEKSGKPIGAYDMQIAAIAIVNNLTLVTHNTNEFSRISWLQLVDWET